MFRKFPQWFDKPPGSASSGQTSGKRPCSQPECADEGVYRAPKSRHHLESGIDDWHWFCLIHARDYNARWNYYATMSEADLEQERRSDVTWQRPSWPLGMHPPNARTAFNKPFEDPFGLFDELDSPLHTSSASPFPPQSPEARALTTLGLSWPLSQEALRNRYRTLVKEHHPDANGGNREAEETLKRINEAYDILKRLV